jgi:myo-inositol 2-dehydrogenase/D-chiro-inositol 1-dehydrogenase
MKKINIGIVGVGRMGSIHLENLVTKFPNARVLAISDTSPNLEALAEKYQVAKVYPQFESMIKDSEINAVVICSPTDLHAEHIIKAAKAGKHIFCEKPMDLSLETVKEVLEIVKLAGVKLFIAFNRRFDPNFQRVEKMVKDGKIGAPQIIKITSRDPGPPPLPYIKVSGGLFLDMAIHDFDMARFISGKEVVEVFSKGTVFIDEGIAEAGDIDTAATILTMEDNSMIIIDNCRKASYGYDQRIEVFGSKGMCGSENKLHDNHFHWDENGIHQSLPMDFFMDRYLKSYYNEMESFLSCLLNNTEPDPSGIDGLMSIAIGLAAKKSLHEGRAVKLSELL